MIPLYFASLPNRLHAAQACACTGIGDFHSIVCYRTEKSCSQRVYYRVRRFDSFKADAQTMRQIERQDQEYMCIHSS